MIMEKCTLIAGVALVGWIVTSIGWIIQRYFADQRETRKEIRDEIDKLENETDKLLKSAHSYYCCSEVEERVIACSEITTSFNRLSGLVQRLEQFDNLKLQKELDALYDAMTGGDFGSTRFTPDCVLYAEQIKRFALLSENLIEKAESWYRQIYQA